MIGYPQLQLDILLKIRTELTQAILYENKEIAESTYALLADLFHVVWGQIKTSSNLSDDNKRWVKETQYYLDVLQSMYGPKVG